MTAIVGSYPKPAYLFDGSGRALLDAVGFTFYELEQQIGPSEFKKRLDRAALMAVEDQNSAGIDFITDGEERRGHYVLYVLRKLGGIDFAHLTEKAIREGKYVRKLPTVVGKITYQYPVLEPVPKQRAFFIIHICPSGHSSTGRTPGTQLNWVRWRRLNLPER